MKDNKKANKKTEDAAPYAEWKEPTYAAYVQTVTEIMRVQTIHANVDIVSIAFMRALMDKFGIEPHEIAQYIEHAKEQGLELLGISVARESVETAEEITAEERYHAEGLDVWDGQKTSPS